jgi:hypothetical protein
LIVEILSPSNQAKNWANVWAYTTIVSVGEIFVPRTDSIGADLLRRRPDGSWPRTPEAIEAGDLILENIDFKAPLTALYRTTRLACRSGSPDSRALACPYHISVVASAALPRVAASRTSAVE